MEKEKAAKEAKVEIACVIFRLENNLFSIPISQLREIAQGCEYISLPGQAENVIGLIELRGRYVPVMDLKQMMHCGASALRPVGRASTEGEGEEAVKTKILVADLKAAAGRYVIGLQVDEVIKVHYLDINVVEAAPSTAGSKPTVGIVGLFKHGREVVRLLDCRKMFTIEMAGVGNL